MAWHEMPMENGGLILISQIYCHDKKKKLSREMFFDFLYRLSHLKKFYRTAIAKYNRKFFCKCIVHDLNLKLNLQSY